jgi:hypothetical protein
MEDDMPEAVELELTAEWRERKVDADPSDTRGAAAAVHLRKLAADLRSAPDQRLLEEYRCICNWLGESDGISDLALSTGYYRERIGFGNWPDTGNDYLRAILELARETFGVG